MIELEVINQININLYIIELTISNIFWFKIIISLIGTCAYYKFFVDRLVFEKENRESYIPFSIYNNDIFLINFFSKKTINFFMPFSAGFFILIYLFFFMFTDDLENHYIHLLIPFIISFFVFMLSLLDYMPKKIFKS
jgi:hypothetical protein|tara:strand:+ start:24707 stop:25117 length:411 start_codon:yes stop_codon:yes gene_type:complete